MEKIHYKIILMSFFISLSFSVIAQNTASNTCTNCTFQINRYDIDKENLRLKVYLNAKDENGDPFNINDLNLIIEEKKLNESDQSYENNPFPTNPKVIGENATEAPTVLFLLDISGSMCGEKIVNAKNAILDVITDNNLPSDKTYFATFHDEVSKSKILTRENYDEVVAPVQACNSYDTDLYYAIDNKVKELNNLTSGRKIIILLADGKNDNVKNPKYNKKGVNRITENELLNSISKLDDKFGIWTIGLGNKSADKSNIRGIDEDFMKSVCAKTSNKEDKYEYASSPDQLKEAFKKQIESATDNIVLTIAPQDCEYTGLKRRLKISYNYRGKTGSDIYDYSEGSSSAAITLCKDEGQTNYLLMAGIGSLLVITLLGILIFIFPLITTRQFKNEYVMSLAKYREVFPSKARLIDPYTLEIIEQDDLIVCKCKQVQLWETWQVDKEGKGGDRCANYDKCLSDPNWNCNAGDGESPYTRKSNFFEQQGINRKLNWLWFGALGGLVTWGIYILLNEILLENGSLFFAQDMFKYIFDSNDLAISNSLLNASLVGLSMGIGITSMLAFVEERGSSQKFDILNIILRILMGALIAIPVFIAGEFMFSSLQDYLPTFISNYIIRLISWIIFGISLGFVVTINSGIKTTNGIKAGFIASLIAYVVFILLITFIKNDEWANLIGYLAYGGILGALIYAVVAKLEDYEIEFLEPNKFSGRKVFVSKWLTQNGDNIGIGTDPASRVFIKWSDIDPAVEGRHAEFIYEDGLIYINPFYDIKINNKPIKVGKLTELENNDVVQIGEKTKFRFISLKKTDDKKRGSDIRNRSTEASAEFENAEVRDNVKKKIKIKKIK